MLFLCGSDTLQGLPAGQSRRYTPTPNFMLVCIDFDGVICDSLLQQLEIVSAAQRIVGFGRKPTIDDFRIIENLSYDGFAELIGIPEVKFGEWRSAVQTLIKSDSTDVPIFLGIDEVLRTIARHYTLVIITSNLESAVNRALKRENLSELVAKVYDGVYPGTKTEKILSAATEYKAKPSSLYMIGDTRSDIRHGHEAGAKTVAVTYGYQSKETLQLERPHFVAENPWEILTCLGV